MLSSAAGVYTFHHDPGELSAAFVWERTVRLFLSTPPPTTMVRYVRGGWTGLIAPLERRARELGVEVETGRRVDTLPEAPVILATELQQASQLLGGESLSWPSGRTVCIDVGLRRHRGDPWIVSDLDESGWIGRYSTSDPSIAPDGHQLVQAQMPIRPGESTEQAGARLERLLDQSLVDWRERETWRRRQVMDARSGALDMPGSTWRDRPAVDRGDGVYLAGDMVARARPARRGLLGQRRRGQPAGAGGGGQRAPATAQGRLSSQIAAGTSTCLAEEVLRGAGGLPSTNEGGAIPR